MIIALPTRFVLAIMLLLLIPADDAVADPDPDPDPESAYVGSSTCAECHPQQAQQWRGSHHHRAMADATGETVLGDFNDIKFSAHGVSLNQPEQGI